MTFLQGVIPIILTGITIKSIYGIYDVLYDIPQLELSLSTYGVSSVYLSGDKSAENLEPNFVAVSRRNKAIVDEATSTSNIIEGMVLYQVHT